MIVALTEVPKLEAEGYVRLPERQERWYLPWKLQLHGTNTEAPRNLAVMVKGVCGREMRDGICTMDTDHRGRCSTVTFYCDGCSKTRRGSPAAVATNPYDDVTEAEFCWFCQNVTNRPDEWGNWP